MECGGAGSRQELLGTFEVEQGDIRRIQITSFVFGQDDLPQEP